MHGEDDKVCKTCADITDQKRIFWIGNNWHTVNDCTSGCENFFYTVEGSSYNCVSECGEFQFGELELSASISVKCVDECSDMSFEDGAIMRLD